jgi:hypothetical protein
MRETNPNSSARQAGLPSVRSAGRSVPFRQAGRTACIATGLVLLFVARPQACAADGKLEAGLALTFSTDSGKVNDLTIRPNVWLYVEAGKPPTPFLPPGKFTAIWQGFVSAELRGTFIFQAELNGSVRLRSTAKSRSTLPAPAALLRSANPSD